MGYSLHSEFNQFVFSVAVHLFQVEVSAAHVIAGVADDDPEDFVFAVGENVKQVMARKVARYAEDLGEVAGEIHKVFVPLEEPVIQEFIARRNLEPKARFVS